MSNDELIAFLSRIHGYERVRCLPNGEIVGLFRFLFTTGLLVGLDRVGYRTRFCYPTHEDAVNAIESWNGIGDPPGEWIKEKGIGVDRMNPKRFAEISIVTEHVT